MKRFLQSLVVIGIVAFFGINLYISLDCKIPDAAPDNYRERW